MVGRLREGRKGKESISHDLSLRNVPFLVNVCKSVSGKW
jgi:hypothetical protein